MNILNGKIYLIKCKTDDTKVYVGSTTENRLEQRLAKHKYKSKTHGHFKLYKEINNDWSNWFIQLYEEFPCSNKKDLLIREGQIIRDIGTLNQTISGRTMKQYSIDNADKIKKYKHEYYIKNYERIRKYKQDYYVKKYKKNICNDYIDNEPS